MSGKPYTIHEFKIIVDYLVENKLYSEIKARKMWMDFANSKRTTRTWQSLKEAFLKRILPDIHNPFFQLTNEQISSFRSRCDLADRNGRKLEIHTISDDSNSNGHDPKVNEPSNEGETTAGENIQCSKVPVSNRSSADTVIIENCYETAEQIQKELESNDDDIKKKPAASKSKSLRDCITYSEPLTPIAQEVWNDFTSEPEDSDREGQMEIVDNGPVDLDREAQIDIVENVQEDSDRDGQMDIVDNVPEDSDREGQMDTVDNVPEDSDREGQMEIVDNVPEDIQEVPEPDNEILLPAKSAAVDVAKNAEVVEEVLAQELDGDSKPENMTPKEKTLNVTDTIEELLIANLDEDISSMVVENGSEINHEADVETPKRTKISNPEKPVAVTSTTPVQSSSVDASLPNNPEALKNNKTPEILRTVGRKRSYSEGSSSTIDFKKKKLDKKSQTPAKVELNGTEPHLDATAEDRLKGKEEYIKPNVIKKPWLGEKTIDLKKPSTSFEAHVIDIIETEKKAPEIKNPCLQNISLYDEQFNKTRYNMSESSDTEQNKKETRVDTQEASVSKPSNDVVVLRSNSESDTEEVRATPKKKQRAGVLLCKTERDKAISNMFGFASGGVGAKRKHQLSRRRRTISHNNAATHHTAAPASNSSDWTSESGSDGFVSPPRSRKNRPTRKYLKPHTHKISALEEEGGLFVMYGKKIYPVVKDGKIVKNYITYLPESDSDEGENFWKQKYVEEKKKAAELKKLLEEVKEPGEIKVTGSRNALVNAPVTETAPLRNSRKSSLTGPSNGVAKEIVTLPEEKIEKTKPRSPEKIKIKFTKNNEEVYLEGHWSQIHPVFDQVVQIFHKEPEMPANENKSRLTVAHPDQCKELSSGASSPIIITPVDPEIHEKVNELEKEIFKEIEERDKEEENQPNGIATNVTKRKLGRPPKTSSSSIHSPETQPKTTSGQETKEPEESSRKRRQNAKDTENNNNTQEISPKPQTRTPRKILNETVNIKESKPRQTRKSTQKLDTSVENEDEEVRYMLPLHNTRRSGRSPASKQTNKKKSSEKSPKILSSPDTASLPSLDSTQGYQNTDDSPANTETRKKKRNDVSSFAIKTRNSLRRSSRRKTHPYEYHDAYNDSSNSSVDASVQVVTRENSSLNSEAYRSESYQHLNPHAKISTRQLEPIDEKTPMDNATYFIRHMESICRNEISAQINKGSSSPSCQMNSDVGSSSNVSLPMSPELSIVENISVSKEMLISVGEYPTINEMQYNDSKEATVTMCSKYMISEVNMSLPLMNQDCEIKNCNTVTEMLTEPKSLVTESLVKKIGNFNINDNVTVTDTLNKKLHDLLLESAQKTTGSESAQKEASMMDVDASTVEVQKKPRASKKRCSTPQKRKGSKKSVAPTVDPVVEEEHVDSCSHSGRKSCPPLFQTNLRDDNAVTEEINIANLTIANEKPKAKKKKDIIRVKIQRPKNKKAAKRLSTKSAQNASKISVFTDSGINDSESEVFVPANDSVDLIHNHSETCLLANECVGDSIEFVENSKSVITLGDSMQSSDNAWSSRCENNDEHSTSPDLFCNNAQDVSFYNNANSVIASTSDTVYHSPMGTEVSHNSLITEDLSDGSPPPAPPSKWYLLSEDETNTNLFGAGSTMLSSGSYGSNLRQLFPIACAIPDLSTITEMSRENDSSRKPTIEDLEGLTGDDFNSLSVFDNFSL